VLEKIEWSGSILLIQMGAGCTRITRNVVNGVESSMTRAPYIMVVPGARFVRLSAGEKVTLRWVFCCLLSAAYREVCS